MSNTLIGGVVLVFTFSGLGPGTPRPNPTPVVAVQFSGYGGGPVSGRPLNVSVPQPTVLEVKGEPKKRHSTAPPRR